MLASIHSAAVVGIEAYGVTVEVDAAQGLPQWTIVGLAVGGVKESRERVAAALVNSGFVVPHKRITINLAPADRKKDGTAFDLPVAIGILVATGQLPAEAVERVVFIGELGLDGSIRPVRGALSVSRFVTDSYDRTTLVTPLQNVCEAGRVSRARLSGQTSLGELVSQLRSGGLVPAGKTARSSRAPGQDVDFAEVVGQEAAKRALEIAAAGAHNVMLVGPPGTGKTMLARRIPTIMPELTEEESLEVIAIHSVAGTLTTEEAALPRRPFRAPHHSVSAAGLVGGGSAPRPGEVSLAHRGVLFLDELPEFPRSVLESLRQPMEDAHVTIARASGSIRYPARFTLVAAMNPCPCGNAGNPREECRCQEADVARYRARISGPLLDRIDMNVIVGAVPVRALGSGEEGLCSAAMRARVETARIRQEERYARVPGVRTNAEVSGRWLDRHACIANGARGLLESAAERLRLSARGYHRVLKVAHTIADLECADTILPGHVAEAVRYRPVRSEARETPAEELKLVAH